MPPASAVNTIMPVPFVYVPEADELAAIDAEVDFDGELPDDGEVEFAEDKAGANEKPPRETTHPKENQMQYYGLRSIVGSQKQPVAIHAPSDSFYRPSARVAPYIEPSFSKEEYPTEKPAIILVSAVGASGKSTTAHALSFDTQLPILDLAKHKPVGDNTLTGILTTAYPIEKVGVVLEGLRKGTHGIIIDGIDEGRSKTTEQGFEAFLDDILERSKGATATSIVIFGRSQVLLNTWLYLADQGADVGLVKIDPFNLDQANGYIDAYVAEKNAAQLAMYEQARDSVLKKLGSAFATAQEGDDAFLSFIGYPPVLDAIATLLRTESNYHRVCQALGDGANGDLEVNLLIRIAEFLLGRERDDKALPNFIDAIASKADTGLAQELRETLYSPDEQCARVLAKSLGREFPRRIVSDNALNEEYEKSLVTWCPEHPFLDDNRVRNAVFEAVAVARCALSTVAEYQSLANDFTLAKRPTYHLLYIMSELAAGTEISVRFFNMLIQSCSEFLGTRGDVAIEIEVNGISWDDSDVPPQSPAELELNVSFSGSKQERIFKFNGTVASTDVMPLGPYLVNTTVTLPCDVELQGTPAFECRGACRVVARSVHVETPDLIVRGIPSGSEAGAKEESGLYFDVNQAHGHANTVSVRSGTVEIGCQEHGLAYPLAKYVRKNVKSVADPEVAEKFLRLRRILSEFASHSKGGLAKYRDKIEHERVLRGTLGKNVLAQLLKEGVLYTDPRFYYVNADQLSKVLGTTWHQLRQHKLSEQVKAFLNRVQ